MQEFKIAVTDEIALALADSINDPEKRFTQEQRTAIRVSDCVSGFARSYLRNRQMQQSMKAMDDVLGRLVCHATHIPPEPALETPPEAMMPQTDADPRAIQDETPAVQVDV